MDDMEKYLIRQTCVEEYETLREKCPEFLEAGSLIDSLETMDDSPRLRRIMDQLKKKMLRSPKHLPNRELVLSLIHTIKHNPNYRDNRVGKLGMRRYDWLRQNDPDLLEELISMGEAESYLNKIDLILECRIMFMGARKSKELRDVITAKTLEMPWWKETEEEYRNILRLPYMRERIKPYPGFFMGMYATNELERLKEYPRTLRNLVKNGELSEHLMSIQEMNYASEKQMFEEYLELHKDEIPPKDSPRYEGWMKMSRMQIQEMMTRS